MLRNLLATIPSQENFSDIESPDTPYDMEYPEVQEGLMEIFADAPSILPETEKINQLSAAVESLLHLHIELKDNHEVSQETLCPLILHMTLKNASRNITAKNITPSLETFDVSYSEAYSVSVENISNFIKEAWKKLLRFLAMLRDNLFAFIKRLFAYNNAVHNKAKQNQQLIGKLSSSSTVIADTMDLSARNVAVVSLVKSGRGEITGDLLGSISSLRGLIINGLTPFVHNQIKGDAATRNIIDVLLNQARSDLEHGRKKDEKIANQITQLANQKLTEAMGVLTKQRLNILSDFTGPYLGGVYVKNDPTTSFFTKENVVKQDGGVAIKFLTREDLGRLNEEATLLSIAVEVFSKGPYKELEDKLNGTLADLSNHVDELAEDYGDYPKLIAKFNSAIDDMVKQHSALLQSIFLIVKAASEASSFIITEFVPKNIAFLESKTEK
jgi:hypothetical protein